MLLALSLPLLSLVTSLIPSVENRLVNVTIDDTYGDPTTGAQFTYVDSEWKPGQGCSGCLAQPDPSLAWNGSWHDATFNNWPGYVPEPNVPLNATVSFNGQALYVYCIIDNNQDQNSYMTFYIDDEVVGSYIKNASNQSSYDYNVLVYQNLALNPGQHTFMLSSGQVNGTDALVLLDYVIYTVDVESNSTSSAPAASLSGLPSSTSSILTSSPQSSPSLLPSSSLQTLPSSDTTASTTMITSSINVTSSGKATSTSSLYSNTTIGTAAAATSSRNGMSSAQLKLTVIMIVVVVVGMSIALCILTIWWYRRRHAGKCEKMPSKELPSSTLRSISCSFGRNQAMIESFPSGMSSSRTTVNTHPQTDHFLPESSTMGSTDYDTPIITSGHGSTTKLCVPASSRAVRVVVPADRQSGVVYGNLGADGNDTGPWVITGNPVTPVSLGQWGQQSTIDVDDIAGNPQKFAATSTVPFRFPEPDTIVVPEPRRPVSGRVPEFENPMTPPPVYRERY